MTNESIEKFEPIDAANARRFALERIRFERLMGLEFLPRTRLQTVGDPVIEAAGRITEEGSKPAAPTLSAREIAAAQLAAAKTAQPTPVPSAVQPPAHISSDKAERWRAVEAQALGCVKCALAQGRTNVVFGTGNRSAQLVFVGEGPGQDEDLQGEPFVGKAGQLLNKIIAAMGLKREDVYICNVVKCRPPGNRTPLPDEVAACAPFLHEQIDLIEPKAIVALGGPAAKTLLNTVTGITALRGRWHMYRGIPVMPTFHPAFVLRQYTEEVRRNVWEDMKKVMEKLKA